VIERLLLDTDTLSEILKGRNETVLVHAAKYAGEAGQFTFTAVTVLAVLYGLHFKDAKQQLLVAQAAFEDNDIILSTFADYVTAGRVRGVARTQGSQLTSDDCLIGACAERLGLPVVTGNQKHFVAMQRAGLRVQLRNGKQP